MITQKYFSRQITSQAQMLSRTQQHIGQAQTQIKQFQPESSANQTKQVSHNDVVQKRYDQDIIIDIKPIRHQQQLLDIDEIMKIWYSKTNYKQQEEHVKSINSSKLQDKKQQKNLKDKQVKPEVKKININSIQSQSDNQLKITKMRKPIKVINVKNNNSNVKQTLNKEAKSTKSNPKYTEKVVVKRFKQQKKQAQYVISSGEEFEDPKSTKKAKGNFKKIEK